MNQLNESNGRRRAEIDRICTVYTIHYIIRTEWPDHKRELSFKNNLFLILSKKEDKLSNRKLIIKYTPCLSPPNQKLPCSQVCFFVSILLKPKILNRTISGFLLIKETFSRLVKCGARSSNGSSRHW